MRTEDVKGSPTVYKEHREIASGIETIYISGPKGVKRMQVKVGESEKMKTNKVKEMIRSVTHGYKEKITIVGVGYRAEEVGGKIEISLGYRAPIKVAIPSGIGIKVKGAGTIIEATGTSLQQVRQYLSTIIEKRPASKDKYNGKGIEK